MRNTIRSIMLVFLHVAWLTSACSQRGQPIQFREVWARTAGEGENSAVYFLIVNRIPQKDTLLMASADVAARVEIHRSSVDDDQTMRMERQEAVAIPADAVVAFQPGGLHVMLIDLQEDLRAGDTFHIELQFERAGEFLIEVEVRGN